MIVAALAPEHNVVALELVAVTTGVTLVVKAAVVSIREVLHGVRIPVTITLLFVAPVFKAAVVNIPVPVVELKLIVAESGELEEPCALVPIT